MKKHLDRLVEKNSFVAFIDLLGAKNLIMSSQSEDVLNHLNFIYSLTDYLCKNSDNKNLSLSTFSDNFIISIPVKNNKSDDVESLLLLTSLLAIIQAQMLHEYGFLFRGGISIGKFYTDCQIVWGEALVKAYTLENTKAKYPRIIFDNNDEYLNMLINDLLHRLSEDVFIDSDDDDYLFVDYINENLFDYFIFLDKTIEFDESRILFFINNGIGNSDENISVKWKWLEKKFKALS